MIVITMVLRTAVGVTFAMPCHLSIYPYIRRYEKEWPLPEGHQERQVVYNVYHILNHHVLFGGGYLGQAQRMMGQILNM